MKLLEYGFYDKIKIDSRFGRHVVAFYRLVRGVVDGGSTLQVTEQVAHFLLYAQPEFVKGRDKLFISTTPAHQSGFLVVDYVHMVVKGERKDMPSHRSSDKPLVFLTTYNLLGGTLVEEAITKAGYDLFSAVSDGVKLNPDSLPETYKYALETNAERIEQSDLVVAVLDGDQAYAAYQMGYAYACHKTIIGFMVGDKKLPFMMEQSMLVVVSNIPDLYEVLQMYYPIASKLTPPTFRAGEVLGKIQAKFKHTKELVK